MGILWRDVREKRTCPGSGNRAIDGNSEKEGEGFSWVDQRSENKSIWVESRWNGEEGWKELVLRTGSVSFWLSNCDQVIYFYWLSVYQWRKIWHVYLQCPFLCYNLYDVIPTSKARSHPRILAPMVLLRHNLGLCLLTPSSSFAARTLPLELSVSHYHRPA